MSLLSDNSILAFQPFYLFTCIARKIAELENTIEALRNQIAAAERAEDAKERIIHVHESMHECELLYIHGGVYDAVKLLVKIADDMSGDFRNNKFLMKRLTGEYLSFHTFANARKI